MSAAQWRTLQAARLFHAGLDSAGRRTWSPRVTEPSEKIGVVTGSTTAWIFGTARQPKDARGERVRQATRASKKTSRHSRFS